MLAADLDCAMLVGPVEGGTDDELLAVLREFGRRGPVPRILLEPRVDTRSWTVRADVDTEFLRPGPVSLGRGSVDERQVSRELMDVLADDRARPFQVGLHDGYLVHVINHGMGDGHLYFESAVALSGAGAAACPELGGAEPRAPLPPVIRTIAREHPARFARALARVAAGWVTARIPRSCTSERFPNAELAARAAASGDTGTDVVVCRGEPGSLSRIDARCRDRSSVAGRGAVIAYHLCRGLEAAGVALADDIGILVDVREHTRDSSRVSMGNAFAVVGVPLPDEDDPAAFGETYRRAVRRENALAQLLASLTVRYPLVRLGRRMNAAAEPGGAGKPVAVTISDFSQAPVLKSLRWLADPARPAVHAVASTPMSENHLAVYVTEARGQLCVSVNFHRSAFPREVIEAALQNALDLIEAWCEGSRR